MKQVEYEVYSINRIDPVMLGRQIKCLKVFGEEEADIVQICEFDGLKTVPLFKMRKKRKRSCDIIEIFKYGQFAEYNVLCDVLRKHHVGGRYQKNLAFVLRRTGEIKI